MNIAGSAEPELRNDSPAVITGERRTTASVHLIMDGGLREDSSFSRVDGHFDELCPILRKETTAQSAVDREVDLGRTGVRMRRVDRARSEESNSWSFKSTPKHADTL